MKTKFILLFAGLVMISGLLASCVPDIPTGGTGAGDYYVVFKATVDGIEGRKFDSEDFECIYGYVYEKPDLFNTLYGNDLIDITCLPDLSLWYEWGDVETEIFNISEIPIQ